MATLVWRAPMHYLSEGDEAAFFAWLNSVPGVVSVAGSGRELHIRLRSARLSQRSLRELVALYTRYSGHLSELAQFATEANSAWFKDPNAAWYHAVFGAAIAIQPFTAADGFAAR